MDYVPTQRAARKAWYKKIADDIEAEGPSAGIPAADATAAKTLATALYDKMDATDQAEAALENARVIERAAAAAELPALRAKIANWKTLPGYEDSGIEGTFGLKGSAPDFDPDTYKPVITALYTAGKVRFDFKKLGADSLAFYCRPRGASVWQRIGQDSRSPFYDPVAITTPGVPEVREYMARGMVADQEIGVDSDIVEVRLG